ncbi:unnamed protein product [Trichogramma brassicae]|uniref:Uncharacterized protein n=1 Tax=Trichogramma brassicae TaxID=86971 RepID=A0A6H5J1V4_9HYME|nr:unnamed protein product [Trichogramma brassicae]
MEREMEYTRQRNLSNTSEERTMFVIDDTSQGGQEASPAPSHHYQNHHHQQQQPQPLQSSRLCEPPDLSLAPPPRNLLQQPSSSSSGIGHYHQQEAATEEQQQYYQQHVLQQQQQPLQQQKRRRNSAIQCDAFSIANSGSAGGGGGGGTGVGSGRPRRQRRPSEFVDTYRRYSTSSGRPRANSVARPTPLGDGRRSSTCKRPSTGSVSGQPNRTRRASNAAAIPTHRRDSVRPTRSPSGQLLTPASLEALQQLHSQSQKKKHSRQEDLLDDLEKNDNEEEDERSPSQRRIASILLGTFLFILAASVLAVVVTLTHSSFHQPPIGSRELQEHRANVNVSLIFSSLIINFERVTTKRNIVALQKNHRIIPSKPRAQPSSTSKFRRILTIHTYNRETTRSQGERGATELAESGSLGTCERVHDDDAALKQQQWKIETSVDVETTIGSIESIGGEIGGEVNCIEDLAYCANLDCYNEQM